MAEIKSSRNRFCSGVCPGCGKSFTRIKWGDDAGVWCSRDCYLAHRSAKKKPSPVPLSLGVCGACGCTYQKPRANSSVCSDTCRRKANALAARMVHKPRACAHCANSFVPAFRWGPAEKYCGAECSTAAKAENVKRGKRVAKSRRRARTRGVEAASIDHMRVFARDKWICHLCGSRTIQANRGTTDPKAPELDHIISLAEGGSHTWGNVACACRKCNGAKQARSKGQLGFNLAA